MIRRGKGQGEVHLEKAPHTAMIQKMAILS